MQNGENIQALHKNLDFVRFVSIFLLLVHCYSTCYEAFLDIGLTVPFVDHLLFKLSHGLVILSGVTIPKLAILLLLFISQFGQKGRKDETLRLRPILVKLGAGLSIYFLSIYLLMIPLSFVVTGATYIIATSFGYLLILSAGARLSRLSSVKLGKD